MIPPFPFSGMERLRLAALVLIPASNSVIVAKGDLDVISSKPETVCP